MTDTWIYILGGFLPVVLYSPLLYGARKMLSTRSPVKWLLGICLGAMALLLAIGFFISWLGYGTSIAPNGTPWFLALLAILSFGFILALLDGVFLLALDKVSPKARDCYWKTVNLT